MNSHRQSRWFDNQIIRLRRLPLTRLDHAFLGHVDESFHGHGQRSLADALDNFIDVQIVEQAITGE
jgi:hypothetical protein